MKEYPVCAHLAEVLNATSLSNDEIRAELKQLIESGLIRWFSTLNSVAFEVIKD